MFLPKDEASEPSGEPSSAKPKRSASFRSMLFGPPCDIHDPHSFIRLVYKLEFPAVEGDKKRTTPSHEFIA